MDLVVLVVIHPIQDHDFSPGVMAEGPLAYHTEFVCLIWANVVYSLFKTYIYRIFV